MVAVIEPDFVESAAEVAVIVTVPVVLGAVKSPPLEIAPAVTFQVTSGLKPPVPCTMSLHWSVSPVSTCVTEHVTVTDVMDGEDGGVIGWDGLPPPPQLIAMLVLSNANKNASFRLTA